MNTKKAVASNRWQKFTYPHTCVVNEKLFAITRKIGKRTLIAKVQGEYSWIVIKRLTILTKNFWSWNYMPMGLVENS